MTQTNGSPDLFLSEAQINERFVDEWVLVDQLQTNEKLEVLRGRVLFHSKNRDEVDQKAIELRPKRFATLFTGNVPSDTIIIL
ncbi:MAG: hypothetical protein L0Y44_06705 [Phycisphaerales bacterium]|nr:hypothetical protein [Phycisphaerales bacterium]MCI0676214.1 hypothetical protein [Phycisphaerales bacterium]